MNIEVLIIAAVIGLIIVGTVVVLLTRYKKCKPNQVLVVYGKIGKNKGAGKCIHGGGTFVWPVIQGYTILDMESFDLDVQLENGLSKQNIKVNLPCKVTLAIGKEEEKMRNAAIRLGDLSRDEKNGQLKGIIQGQLRQVVSTMDIEELISDRDGLRTRCMEAIAAPMSELGISIINITISDISDEAEYIMNLGKKAAQEAASRAKAQIAEQVKIGEVGVAQQEKEQAIQTSEIQRDRNVEVATNAKIEAEKTAEIEQQRATNVAKATREKQVNLRTIAREQAVQIRDQEKQEEVSKRELQKEEAIAIAEQAAQEASTVAETEKLQSINVATAESQKAQKVAEQNRLRDVEVI